MISIFAADPAVNDPVTYYFDKGVLGITIVALIIVIRFMWNYFTKKLDAKDLEIQMLNNARLDDNKAHTTDYREMAKNDQTVLLGNAQAQQLLASKIEIAKGRE